MYLVGGYLALFVVRSHGDRFTRFFRAGAVGSILLDALQPNYTEFRLELTFVPIAAAGLAVGLTSLQGWVARHPFARLRPRAGRP